MRAVCIVLALLGLATAAPPSVQQFINDNHVMNYALTLENFEARLYAEVSRFNQSAFTSAGFPDKTRATIEYIGGIESQHALLLTSTLNTRGWPAVRECQNYNFSSIVDVKSFMNTLALVEAVGTSAYDGAALAITDKNVLELAAGIATVEGRHTALLNTVSYPTKSGQFTPFLNGDDRSTPFNFTYVQSLIKPFFLGATCPTSSVAVTYLGGATYTVQSSNASSYQWQSANSLRGVSSDLLIFYKQANSTVGNNDLSVLNYALTLENLEAAFYASYASLYSVQKIQDAGFDADTAANINANFAAVAAHEAAHVKFLNSTIYNLGGIAATPCNYNVSSLNLTSTSTFADFLTVAANLENTGVTAYVGAIKYIANADVTSIAATIATVEAEHAAYIANLLVNVGQSAKFNPFPNATGISVANGTYDGPTPPTEVLANINLLTLLNCTSSSLGTPGTITATAFFNLYNDQDNFNTNPGSTTTSSTSSGSSSTSANNAPSTTTTTVNNNSNSAAAVVASAAVAALAMLF